MDYSLLIKTLLSEAKAAPKNVITTLAERLIIGGQSFDLAKTQTLDMNFRITKIQRNYNQPPNYTHESVLGAPYADDEKQPLAKGEKWNHGRRASNTGLKYTFNASGHPVNPFMNTGLDGRGVLGQFGPNHAVDNGILRIKENADGKTTLHAFGILRKFDNDAPALSGGFAKYSCSATGAYIFDRDAMIDTQSEELFEEMISGSIALVSPYKERLKSAIQDEYDTRMKGRNGQPLSHHQKDEIAEQVETALKLDQVNALDPDFMIRLREVVAKGHSCFAGPMLNDNRNTNNAWIETRLSWFMMDDATWAYVKGPSPVFPYAFSAGDDASGVVEHEITPQLIKDAFASHGALFTFLAASYLLKTQQDGQQVGTDIITQLSEVADYLAPFNGSYQPPEPRSTP
tara:strand:- start:260983 stop:262185 length:1203 start_codon:yes stop_codon:yes gene_type:complete